jgi:periplasmic protein TonB
LIFAPGAEPAGAANFGARVASFAPPMVAPKRMNFGHAPLCRGVRPETARAPAAFCAPRTQGCSHPIEKTKLSALSAEFNTMKAVSKLAVLISLGAVASFASAKNSEDAYLETCRKDPGVPVPVAVVAPSVSADYNGSEVQIEFIVDETGKPDRFRVKSTPDDTVALAVVDAVKQWRFNPALADGKPVATKVVLPVKIVDEFARANRYAAN